MTRKEIQKVISDNPDKQLYLSYGGPSIQKHSPASKTSILRNSAAIHAVRISTYGEERPDLARYLDRPNGAEMLGWSKQIVTFDATEVE